MEAPLFLTRDQILGFHAEQLRLFGGQSGLADAGLLESAISQPQNLYLYDASSDLFDIASAYAFHLAKNHPFQDGNKRTALQAALGFLELNHHTQIVAPVDSLHAAMIRLATSEWTKAEFADFLRLHASAER